MDKKQLIEVREAAEQGAWIAPETVKEIVDTLLDYENRITWSTTCAGCAEQLTNSYEEYVRISTHARASECEDLADLAEYGGFDWTYRGLRSRAEGYRQESDD